MRRLRWLGMVSAAAVAAVIATSTADAQQCPKGTLRIYTSWPTLPEVIPDAGAGARNGVDMAIAEAGGAVAGYCLEVVKLDNSSRRTGTASEAFEAENAHRAVADPQAVVYIGPYNSGTARISMPITNRAYMAQISPAATYPGLTRSVEGTVQGEPWIYRPLALVNFFRPVVAADVQAVAGAKWAKSLGVKKAFVVNDGLLYGKGIAGGFEATAKRVGLAIMANADIDERQLLTKIRASGADLVYMGGISGTGAQILIRQMREVGLVAPGVRFMGPGHLLSEELLRDATCEAAMATDVRVTFAGLPFEKLKGIGAKTYADYKKTFGEEPTPFALYAVEAARVAIDGIRRAAGDLDRAKDVTDKREAVRKAIAATKSFDGILGRWSFDRNGDIDYDDDKLDRTMSGFKVVKADGPLGCKFQFETIIE